MVRVDPVRVSPPRTTGSLCGNEDDPGQTAAGTALWVRKGRSEVRWFLHPPHVDQSRGLAHPVLELGDELAEFVDLLLLTPHHIGELSDCLFEETVADLELIETASGHTPGRLPQAMHEGVIGVK